MGFLHLLRTLSSGLQFLPALRHPPIKELAAWARLHYLHFRLKCNCSIYFINDCPAGARTCKYSISSICLAGARTCITLSRPLEPGIKAGGTASPAPTTLCSMTSLCVRSTCNYSIHFLNDCPAGARTCNHSIFSIGPAGVRTCNYSLTVAASFP